MSDTIFHRILTDTNTYLSASDLVNSLVTPLAPYVLCRHYIATEVRRGAHKYVQFVLDLKDKNNLLSNKNYDAIKDFDIIQVQVDYLNYFYTEVLPQIIERDLKIVLMTSQYHLPQIHKSETTDKILQCENIILWISQNPIYSHVTKYMAFPYGLEHLSLDRYIKFCRDNIHESKKPTYLLNQSTSVHGHLPSYHIRKQYDVFGKNSGERLEYPVFLKNILRSKFVMSPTGDREDCFRHYECIGLGSIPISNANISYQQIFQDSMIFAQPQEMFEMVASPSVVCTEYHKPCKDILTIEYWIGEIKKRIEISKQLGTNPVYHKFKTHIQQAVENAENLKSDITSRH